MSTEEQHAIVGRLMAELSAAKRELALARQSLRDRTEDWSQLTQAAHSTATPESVQKALALAKELAARDALARTQALLEDLTRLPKRIAEIEETLRAAGIEFK